MWRLKTQLQTKKCVMSNLRGRFNQKVWYNRSCILLMDQQQAIVAERYKSPNSTPDDHHGCALYKPSLLIQSIIATQNG